MSGVSQAVFMNQRSFGTPPGQACFCNIGTATYTWTVPTGVTKISVLLVGAGGFGGCGYFVNVICPCCASGNYSYQVGGGGGGGGALGYKNNYCVTPGTQYKIKFTASSQHSDSSVVFATCGCSTIFSVRNARGGSLVNSGAAGPSTATGVQTSFAGGNGGAGMAFFGSYGVYADVPAAGGGSSAGYAGNGKAGTAAASGAGTAGCNSPGSGGSGTSNRGGGGGGGVGRYGNATGTTNGAAGAANGGGGGGANCGGNGVSTTSVTGGDGGSFGAGGGGGGVSSANSTGSRGLQGKALIRILWPGCARSYPATRTADE